MSPSMPPVDLKARILELKRYDANPEGLADGYPLMVADADGEYVFWSDIRECIDEPRSTRVGEEPPADKPLWPYAPLPPQLQEKVDAWISANRGDSKSFYHGVFPLCAVTTWIERAERAEKTLREPLGEERPNVFTAHWRWERGGWTEQVGHTRPLKDCHHWLCIAARQALLGITGVHEARDGGNGSPASPRVGSEPSQTPRCQGTFNGWLGCELPHGHSGPHGHKISEPSQTKTETTNG